MDKVMAKENVQTSDASDFRESAACSGNVGYYGILVSSPPPFKGEAHFPSSQHKVRHGVISPLYTMAQGFLVNFEPTQQRSQDLPFPGKRKLNRSLRSKSSLFRSLFFAIFVRYMG
ncbi:hypothetical protein AC579_5230 [Pseudocercospora musae]|uniref:Uncharacterized protein n=1 Tax=Pseudocercospora musae TaxID=113226 RepID=A0A139IPX6_9PEZI|nr:hypothetical protein AC579_5230 [Pseudocercospora musae]